MNKDNDNIVQLGQIKGGKPEEDNVPINNYVLTDIDDNKFFDTGFMIFTAHHIAIMQDGPGGAVPALVLPINRVKAAQLVDDDEVFE